MKYHVGDSVVALSGDYAHRSGMVLQVVPVAAKREPTYWIYHIRFSKGTHWVHERALRKAYRHEVIK